MDVARKITIRRRKVEDPADYLLEFELGELKMIKDKVDAFIKKNKVPPLVSVDGWSESFVIYDD